MTHMKNKTPVFKNFYLIFKEIVTESGLLTCTFNDEENTIRCNQFDNDFTIAVGEDSPCETTHRFTVDTEGCYYYTMENPGRLIAHAKFLFVKIYQNLFNNDYRLTVTLNETPTGLIHVNYFNKGTNERFETRSDPDSEVVHYHQWQYFDEYECYDLDYATEFEFDEDADLLGLLDLLLK